MPIGTAAGRTAGFSDHPGTRSPGIDGSPTLEVATVANREPRPRRVVISPDGVGRRVVANFGPTLDLIVTSLFSARRSGMARSRAELFEQIGRDWRAGGSSIRELAVATWSPSRPSRRWPR